MCLKEKGREERERSEKRGDGDGKGTEAATIKSIEAHLIEEQQCQISPRSELKRGKSWALLSFEDVAPTRTTTMMVMSSDMGPVPDEITHELITI